MLELAAMLWSLLRRSQRSLDPIIERLGAELEVAAVERAARQRSGGSLERKHACIHEERLAKDR